MKQQANQKHNRNKLSWLDWLAAVSAFLLLVLLVVATTCVWRPSSPILHEVVRTPAAYDLDYMTANNCLLMVDTHNQVSVQCKVNTMEKE